MLFKFVFLEFYSKSLSERLSFCSTHIMKLYEVIWGYRGVPLKRFRYICTPETNACYPLKLCIASKIMNFINN